MIKDFWQPLVSELANVAHDYYDVKIVTLLFVDSVLPEGSIESLHCCTSEHYDREKLLEIPLASWTPADIRDWLARYSGLGLARPEIERMADHIHRAAGGLPQLVAHELLSRCSPSPNI
jgi:hypothetical protein